jgi:hypothetical protein
MTHGDSGGRPGKGVGALFLIGLLAGGFLIAVTWPDLRRYLKMRTM